MGDIFPENNNQRNEWTWTHELGERTGQFEGLDRM